MHWIHPSYSDQYSSSDINCKIRYRQDDQSCTISITSDGNGHISFAQAQRAVSPGQVIVFYDNDTMIGSAIISDQD